jgi:phosphoglucomutase
MTIKFGTSGWRDIMAAGFTFPNVRICSQAIAQEIFREKNHNKPVVVGYDTRFLSDRFAAESARILANNGLEVRLSDRDVPTPVVAYEILRSGAAGGVNVTASHNPFDYNGIKFSTSWGGPALRETTNSIESSCAMMTIADVANAPKSTDPTMADKLIRRLDFRDAYFKHIRTLVDGSVFKRRKLKVVVDVLYGTARGYLPDLLREWGCDVEVIRDCRDVMFEGKGPDPSGDRLTELVSLVKKNKAHLGLACDGDADRFGIVDAGGTIFSANEILALLTKYIHVSRGWNGIIARSVMTTHAMDAVARKYNLEIKETPVGFKYIGEIMKEADSVTPSTEGEFVMGGEESGGFTMRGHVPEKDGILACLMVAEMVASSNKTLQELMTDLHKEVGVFLTQRINLPAKPEIVTALRDWFSHKPPVEIDGLHVHRIIDIDGYKFIFNGGSWLGVRFSGTEPIVRLYYEGDSDKRLDVLRKAGESLLHSAQNGKGGAGSSRKSHSLAHH